MRSAKSYLLAILVFLSSTLYAQVEWKGWHLRDEKQDSFYGISLNKTYDFLKKRTSKPIIVAVIDSGVDTAHEDLKPILWRNPKEIPGNSIDDDNNGYIDDIYGWNFIGGKDGRNIKTEAGEASRVYHRYKSKYFTKIISEEKLSKEDKEEYELWKKAAGLLQLDPKEQVELMFLEVAYRAAKKHEKILKAEMKLDTFTLADVEKYRPQTMQAKQAKLGYITFLKITDLDTEENNQSLLTDLGEYLEGKKKAIDAINHVPENYRDEVVKDNYFNIEDRYYGNNNVMGPSPMHGTHVSGIIAADRTNHIGCEGIADNVKIMTIRAIPEGDEYDKDIALAIIYAVNNGAKVINMSFGKGLSPEKKWVDEAIRYAEMKDVLLVHAAGNEAENIDTTENYPNPNLVAFNKKAGNYITVGASCDPRLKGELVADFSNYGKHTVNVFAPGVKIYSTLPGGDKYGYLKGTSMAAPVVSGVAALIRSYYPDLSARQVKYAIEKSVITVDTPVKLPNGDAEKQVTVKDLCTSGGLVNALAAIRLASTLEGEHKVVKKAEVLPKSSFKNLPVKQ